MLTSHITIRAGWFIESLSVSRSDEWRQGPLIASHLRSNFGLADFYHPGSDTRSNSTQSNNIFTSTSCQIRNLHGHYLTIMPRLSKRARVIKEGLDKLLLKMLIMRQYRNLVTEEDECADSVDLALYNSLKNCMSQRYLFRPEKNCKGPSED
jgi:alpha-galactosidase